LDLDSAKINNSSTRSSDNSAGKIRKINKKIKVLVKRERERRKDERKLTPPPPTLKAMGTVR